MRVVKMYILLRQIINMKKIYGINKIIDNIFRFHEYGITFWIKKKTTAFNIKYNIY